MKYFLQILSLTTVIALMMTFQPVIAQSDIDTNRMNRDINIMENVLEELFKMRSSHGNHVRVNTGSFGFGHHSKGTNGTYLPDYGVIFTIQSRTPGFVMITSDDDEEFSFNFEYGDDANGEKVTEESITNKMVEFLRDYGSTISQLKDDQNVAVIYKSQTTDRSFAVFGFDDDDRRNSKKMLPTISVTAKVADLKDYRSGDISDSDFRDRLDISTTDSSAETEKDLRVMANILETAFEDTREQSFRVGGPVDVLKLENFGAIFSFNSRYSEHSPFDFSDLHESIKVIKKDLEDVKVELKEEFRTTVDSVRSEKRKKIEANREEQKQKALKAYEQFLTDLKSTIADYGRTLRSVQSDQQILISVALNSRFDDIPERVDLQVHKSGLENGNRDQIINEINVREY